MPSWSPVTWSVPSSPGHPPRQERLWYAYGTQNPVLQSTGEDRERRNHRHTEEE